jgi:hypothetical protein
MKKIIISLIITAILFASIGTLAKKPDNFNYNAGNKNKKLLAVAKKAGVLIPLLFVVKPTAKIIKHLFNKKSSENQLINNEIKQKSATNGTFNNAAFQKSSLQKTTQTQQSTEVLFLDSIVEKYI